MKGWLKLSKPWDLLEVNKFLEEEPNPKSGGNWGKREGEEWKRDKQNESVRVLGGIRILQLFDLNIHLGIDTDDKYISMWLNESDTVFVLIRCNEFDANGDNE